MAVGARTGRGRDDEMFLVAAVRCWRRRTSKSRGKDDPLCVYGLVRSRQDSEERLRCTDEIGRA